MAKHRRTGDFKPQLPADPLAIPTCLMLGRDQRAASWHDSPPRPMPMFVERKQTDEQDRLAAEQLIAEMEQARRQRALDRVAKMKARKQSRSPAGQPMHLTHRWDARRNRWVPLDATEAATVQQRSAEVQAKTRRQTGSVDDLGQRVSELTSVDGKPDVSRLKALAELNGVWKPDYDALPNPGLIRMTVVNRLRRLESVIWK